jgi:quercetin dioxygenase-like cupin family protein
MKKLTCISAMLLVAILSNAQTDSAWHDKQHIVTPNDIKWQAGPPTLPPGAKFCVIEGDLKKEGLIVMRLLLPAGYIIPAHTHPGAERAIVLSGTYHMGTGDKFRKEDCTKMPAGSIGIMPAGGIPHFGWASEETIIQVHMEGPLQINYVNPDDDPRLKQERKN